MELATSAVVGEYCTLGYPSEMRSGALRDRTTPVPAPDPVIIGARCLLFNQIIIYEGVHIGEDCVLEDRVRVGYNSRVGPRTRLLYGAYLCDRVVVGSNTRVAGFVCDGATIGDRSTVMGSLVHDYTRPHQDWWEVDEDPPVVESDTVIGYGSTVVGGVRIGRRSYVAAGAVVTKDVPPDHIVVGVNVHTPSGQWRGSRLRTLIEHWEGLRRTDQA